MLLRWYKYASFFELWQTHEWDLHLIYIIGERHHCYVGSIGSKDGGGLHTRYQKQYIDRAKAIFGASEPKRQPAFAARIPKGIPCQKIKDIEATVQHALIRVHGNDAALFRPIKKFTPVPLHHKGNPPAFLA